MRRNYLMYEPVKMLLLDKVFLGNVAWLIINIIIIYRYKRYILQKMIPLTVKSIEEKRVFTDFFSVKYCK